MKSPGTLLVTGVAGVWCTCPGWEAKDSEEGVCVSDRVLPVDDVSFTRFATWGVVVLTSMHINMPIWKEVGNLEKIRSNF